MNDELRGAIYQAIGAMWRIHSPRSEPLDAVEHAIGEAQKRLIDAMCAFERDVITVSRSAPHAIS